LDIELEIPEEIRERLPRNVASNASSKLVPAAASQ
jgi:hypothetical protein